MYLRLGGMAKDNSDDYDHPPNEWIGATCGQFMDNVE